MTDGLYRVIEELYRIILGYRGAMQGYSSRWAIQCYRGATEGYGWTIQGDTGL